MSAFLLGQELAFAADLFLVFDPGRLERVEFRFLVADLLADVADTPTQFADAALNVLELLDVLRLAVFLDVDRLLQFLDLLQQAVELFLLG